LNPSICWDNASLGRTVPSPQSRVYWELPSSRTFIGGGARFMFAWDADPARVDALARDIRAVSAAS
jgi:hypothetical protein